MFESLSDKILNSVKKLRGQSTITESNIEDIIKEIRMSLLEADVNFSVVKNFIERVKKKAIGTDVIKNVNPGQMFTKIVHDELIQTLGGEKVDVNVRENPSVVMMVGLQGAGKTTSTAKLGLYLRQKLGKKVGFVPADIYRPAAIEQLQILAKQNNFSCFNSNTSMKPEDILNSALDWAKKELIEVLILDTAGRLQIDDDLMAELENLKKIITPTEILLVADAMLGQQAVSVAETFHQRLGLTGLILTKVDGDARGGAALSIREMTGIPIKFMGVVEKVSALEVFHPDRLAGRILYMGDVLSLVERAQEVIDHKEAEISAKKMMNNQFTLTDFLKQIQQFKKLGGIESMLKFLPGMGEISKQMKNMAPPDTEMKKIEAIINSMTVQEREDHRILNGSRRQRIANGSGTKVQDVNKLIKQFEESKKMMSGLMSGMGRRGAGMAKGGKGPMGFPF